ncbi:MAG: hypothetical protein A3I10_02390 [Deltaproteobacteria bacterium RIFCSPLOWO2_02_FULL_57_26]|nr:MAG: hypothetical protein A3I10_02390 [Deltaproteobacteria bacterium RIFCSPLOWO2_02_FULL_57_26]OGQ79535.1 MAG: hypothetical protein A3G40_13290 [Deltaproteobacteria bacterium RIFCSPLOWO2_12_FULL_57_22]
MLLTATVLVFFWTYRVWEKGPWDLPKPAKSKELPVAEQAVKESSDPQSVSTKVIVDKNLFDPERGAGQTQEGAASSVALQRIRSMVLVGTAILGNTRYAIFQEPSTVRTPAPRVQASSPSMLRLKLGDTIEGFALAEINENRVVFSKGASKVELTIDFSRKVEEPRQKASAPSPLSPPPQSRIPRARPGEVPATRSSP